MSVCLSVCTRTGRPVCPAFCDVNGYIVCDIKRTRAMVAAFGEVQGGGLWGGGGAGADTGFLPGVGAQ